MSTALVATALSLGLGAPELLIILVVLFPLLLLAALVVLAVRARQRKASEPGRPRT